MRTFDLEKPQLRDSKDDECHLIALMLYQVSLQIQFMASVHGLRIKRVGHMLRSADVHESFIPLWERFDEDQRAELMMTATNISSQALLTWAPNDFYEASFSDDPLDRLTAIQRTIPLFIDGVILGDRSKGFSAVLRDSLASLKSGSDTHIFKSRPRRGKYKDGIDISLLKLEFSLFIDVLKSAGVRPLVIQKLYSDHAPYALDTIRKWKRQTTGLLDSITLQRITTEYSAFAERDDGVTVEFAKIHLDALFRRWQTAMQKVGNHQSK